MKRTLLTICSAALFAFTSNAQTVEVSVHGGAVTDISGTTHIEVVSTADLIEVSFDVTNTSAATEDYIITRLIQNEPSGWSNYFCWGHSTDPFGGTCYSVSADQTFISANAITIAPNEYGILKCYVNHSTPSAVAGSYRYYIGTATNPKMDSIDLEISSVLSVAPIKKDFSLSVSPNPASDFVNIKVSNLETGSLKIVDVLGNVVMSSSFNGSKSINIEDFKNGVYFIMISGDGMKAINRKLVVRH